MAIGRMSALYNRIFRAIETSLLDQMFCFSLPKAIFASDIRLLMSAEVLGTFDPRKMKSWTVSKLLLSIEMGLGLGVIAFHFPALIFMPYFMQAS